MDWRMIRAFIVLNVLLVAHGYPYLIFANLKDIRLVDVQSRKGNWSVIVDDLEEAGIIDFFYQEQVIYWTDNKLDTIKGKYLNGSKDDFDVITTGLLSPDGLACDWIGKKLYWTDSETNRIEVSNLDGTHRKALFIRNLDQPRAISVTPTDGLMFWTDWSSVLPRIERASMDGNRATRQIIVKDDIAWPNGLTIDYDGRRLYWADAKLQTISTIDYDGRGRKIIIKGSLPHPFAVTLYKDSLYWTDWQTKAVHSCDKRTGGHKSVVVTGDVKPMGVQVYVAERQKRGESSPCDYNNGGCSHLCLMSSESPFYTCACPTGILLSENDSRTCEKGPKEIVVVARRTDLRMISLDTEEYVDVVLQLKGVKNAIAVDYDPVDEKIYWVDEETKEINRVFLNGSDQETVIASELYQPQEVAVDWIARNLFWTDTGTDRIEVSRLDGAARKVVISDDLHEPRAITVDPPDGYIYWTDWGNKPKIERAAMDGSGRTALISTNIGWPNGLALDYSSRKLYWGDARTDKIEVVNLDGTGRRVLVQDVLHVYGFSILGDYVYWTDWNFRAISRAHKVTGEGRKNIIEALPDMMGLKAVNVNKAEGTNPCAVNNGKCSHLCLNRPGNDYVCACSTGLSLASDGRTCVVPEAYLLFTNKANIRRISLESQHNDTIPVPGIELGAFDYDVNNNRIYWVDVKLKTINRAFMNGSKDEKLVEFGLEYPEAMAVDWVAQNMYWADMGLNRIEVSRLDGSSRKVLLWKDIESPKSIAVNPSERYLYWSEWGNIPKIEQSLMDGTKKDTVVKPNGRANSLTIDYNDKRLYWTDVDSNVIETTDLSGNDRFIIQKNGKPFALTQFEQYIYWTDSASKTIEKANKLNGMEKAQLRTESEFIIDISVYHQSRQSGWNRCAVYNGGCSHLCLATPVDQEKLLPSLKCSCPTHYELSKDNKTCKPFPQNFLLFSQKTVINRIAIDTANSPDIVLPIHGLKNIRGLEYDPVTNFIYWIDGKSHAIRKGYDNGTAVLNFISNSNDNMNPFDMVLDPYSRILFWTCSKNNVINVTKLDGEPVGVIFGGKDERPRNLALHPHKSLIFWTNLVNPPRIERSFIDGRNRTVIVSSSLKLPNAIAVDAKSNLLFWSDTETKRIESSTIDGRDRRVLVQGFQATSLAIHENYLYFMDKSEQSVMKRYKYAGSGEQPSTVLSRISHLSDILAVGRHVPIETLQKHPCFISNGNCSHLCMVTEDGLKRCSCPAELVLNTYNGKLCMSPPSCPPKQFACFSGKVSCIPSKYRCNGNPECEDGSDEVDCPSRPFEFRCYSGEFINKKNLCDGVDHCKDGSDEVCCHQDSFLCHSTPKCIKRSQVCDDTQDCQDNSDEEGCHEVSTAKSASEPNKASYTIGIVIAAVVMLLAALLAYFCKRKPHGFEYSEDGNMLSLRTPYTEVPSYPSRNGTCEYASNHKGSSGLSSCTHSQMYDRNHITGASSSSSSGTHYPRETLNPPPSPVTVHSCDFYFPSHPPSTIRPHRYHRSRSRPHPPTPCSTDVCDDSEPYPYRERFYNSHMELSLYDSDPNPPPPTPRSHCMSDDTCGSCPPSPSTVKSFCNPPPPSPVPESDY